MGINLLHLLLIGLLLGSCARKNKQTESKKNKIVALTETASFNMIESKKEQWTAGHAKGGSGTDYYLTMVINTKEELRFDSAWVNQKILPIFLASNRPSISDMPITFSLGDTITLRITDILNQNQETKLIELPMEHEGELLFRYWLQNQAHYYSLNNIQTIDSPNRQ